MTRSIWLTLMLAPLLAGEANALCIKASEANLRKGPGTQYDVSWLVYSNMPLREIGQRGNWYKVEDVDGDRHWVHHSLIGRKIRCGVVKSNRANIRSGPGVRYSRLEWSPVTRYYAFEITSHSGRWAKILDAGGNSGWIAKSLIWQH